MQKQAHSRAIPPRDHHGRAVWPAATLRAGSHSPWGCRVAATPGYRVTSGRKSVPGTYRCPGVSRPTSTQAPPLQPCDQASDLTRWLNPKTGGTPHAQSL